MNATTTRGLRKRVLLIDDDSDVRGALGEIVAVLGYDTELAASGAEGMTLFDANHFDIVLTDLLMPGMTGWEVVDEVRKRNPKTPVLIITGSALYPEDRRGWKPGVALVSKPVDMNFLENAIAKMIQEAERS